MNNQIKNEQLGMPHGTAANILRKNIMFALLVSLDLNKCFQCGEKIESPQHLTIEHKVPWLHSENPKELFFSLDNIAFSHLTCNAGAARSYKRGQKSPHGTLNRYRYHKCRCDLCRRANADDSRLRKRMAR